MHNNLDTFKSPIEVEVKQVGPTSPLVHTYSQISLGNILQYREISNFFTIFIILTTLKW